MPIQTLNPYTNKVEKTFDELSESQVNQAVELAHDAFLNWKNTSIDERAEMMHKVASILRKNADHYAKLMTVEMGKLFNEGKSWEVKVCADIADYYAKNAKTFLKKEPISDISIGSAHLEKHPFGVLFGIMPWNYPMYQVFRFVCPNIMAGNVCLVKHASNVPQCAQAIEDLFTQAGFPKGIYTNLFARSKLAGTVIAHPKVSGISFTGSERAGASVAQQAGQHLKKVVLELGGSDPFIVLNDADLDYTIEMALIAKMFNNGQTCVAAKRFIVEEEIYDRFLKGLKEKMAALVTGDPMLESTTYCPMSSQGEVDNLIEVIEEAVEKGATLELGGEKEALEGAWLKPTILTNVDKTMRAGCEELFGPVAVVYKVNDENEAIRLANDSPYGLGSSIFSKDISKAQQLASRLETGMTFINSPTASEPGLPFGGVKKSGFGRELSHLGMDEFINKKLIRTIPNYLIWMKGFMESLGFKM